MGKAVGDDAKPSGVVRGAQVLSLTADDVDKEEETLEKGEAAGQFSEFTSPVAVVALSGRTPRREVRVGESWEKGESRRELRCRMKTNEQLEFARPREKKFFLMTLVLMFSLEIWDA